jgi:hypothetical protein
MAQVRIYKEDSLAGVKPNSVVALKVPNEDKFELFVTDLQGVPYSLKTISGGGGAIQTITNTDGNITITGSNNLTINITPSLLSVINSALQVGDNISDLNNDAGYITIETDPIFQASEASLFVTGDKFKLDTAVQPSDLGAVATSNDYNDLNNLPTIPTKTSDLTNDGEDGVNPFITAQDIPEQTIPTLDQVTTEGNTTTNGIIVGGVETEYVRLLSFPVEVDLKAEGITESRELFAPDENGTIATREWVNNNLPTPVDISGKLDKDFSTFTDKPTPSDTDLLPLYDGANKKLTLANLKSTLKSYFDTIYQNALNAINLGQIIFDELAIKSTPSADDEIVMYDSLTGEAVTAKFSSFSGNHPIVIASANNILSDNTTSGNVLRYSFKLDANSIPKGSRLDLLARISKVNTTPTADSFRIYITNNELAPTQTALASLNINSNLYSPFERSLTFDVTSGNIFVSNPTAPANSDNVASTTALTEITFDPTVDHWINIYMQVNTSNVMTMRDFKAILTKPL